MEAPVFDLLILVNLEGLPGPPEPMGVSGGPCRESWLRTQGPWAGPDLHVTLGTVLGSVGLVSPSVSSLSMGPG